MIGVLITNNKRVRQAYAKGFEVVFVEGDLSDVLRSARDYVHKGYELLTHPLSGSVKPNENPFKSVLLSAKAKMGGQADFDSLRVIENAILTADKFTQKYPFLSEQIREDFETVDYSLIKSALGGG